MISTCSQMKWFTAMMGAFAGRAQPLMKIAFSFSIPTILPTSLGYHHHGRFILLPAILSASSTSRYLGIEYWQSPDPSGPATTRQCSADGEDPSCSASIPSKGLTPAHLTVCLDPSLRKLQLKCFTSFAVLRYSSYHALLSLKPLWVEHLFSLILSCIAIAGS